LFINGIIHLQVYAISSLFRSSTITSPGLLAIFGQLLNLMHTTC
jgi:hypothetical protein